MIRAQFLVGPLNVFLFNSVTLKLEDILTRDTKDIFKACNTVFVKNGILKSPSLTVCQRDYGGVDFRNLLCKYYGFRLHALSEE